LTAPTETRAPHHAAGSCGEGMTDRPTCGPAPPTGTPGHDERTDPHHDTQPETPAHLLRGEHRRRPRRRPQGPTAATRSRSARAMTPTPSSPCPHLSKKEHHRSQPAPWPAPLLQGWPEQTPRRQARV